MNIIEMEELELTIQKILTSSVPLASQNQMQTSCNGNASTNTQLNQYEEKLATIREHLSNQEYEKVILDFLSSSKADSSDLCEVVDHVLSEGPMERHLEILCVGISALQLFVCSNWTGKESKETKGVQKELSEFNDVNRKSINKILAEDVAGESVESVCKLLELLYLAYVCLFEKTVKNSFADNWSIQWWQLRFLCANQQIVTEKSDVIYQKTLQSIKTIEKYLEEPQRIEPSEVHNGEISATTYQTFFYLEASSFYATYFDVANMTKYAEKALEKTGMQIHETGILGKRTKFQQKDLPQFTLNLTKNDSNAKAGPERPQNDDNKNDATQLHFPKDLKLDDEVRLDKIHFVDERTYPVLTKIEQCIVFAVYNIVKRSKPKDDLANEQLLPYLETVLSGELENQIWALRTNALLERSKLERDNRRTVERSLMQIETLLDSIRQTEDLERRFSNLRMENIYITKLPPSWQLEVELVRLYQSMGSVKSALDLSLKLELWEDVISCYHILKLRHKAAEVIQTQIQQKGETPLLLCMLGDATDEEKYYLRALELSSNKSSRAYKALGMKAYYNKDYSKAVDLLSKSIDCNRFQPDVLLRLGYASLDIENWKVAATTYRMYCNYEPDNFEAWNNLAKAYINLDDKFRAFTVLQEAAKVDYGNWKIWDNILVISVQCGHFEETIRAYHRILDIRESKSQNSFEGNTKIKELVDSEVLSALVKAVTSSEILDAFGESAQTKHAPALCKLFGRIAALSPKNEKFYELFATLIRSSAESRSATDTDDSKEKLYKAAQLMQKATAAFQTNNQRWECATDQCIEGINLFSNYGKYCLESGDSQQLVSAKMSIKSVITKVKKAQTSFETGEINEQVLVSFKELEKLLDLVVETIKNN